MKFPKLTNGQYDRIKQFLLMVVPGALAMITGAGVMNGFNTEKVTGTIAIVATFAGILLNWIAGKYDKGDE
ncbi:holin [Lactococcus raffinolactis]|uniref:Holin n=1 Tax=Pseudolactococcus raffinolactis TaxID=1366 RepID=A0AAE7CRZ7_9LACT|nr:holin [Lactococcus raffinolactis]QIW57905.1 holin [Lactococcus raffinolactis]